MTYKHGNWFCRPANEAEAKDIIERAVASGAVDRGNWSFDADEYGVYMGRVCSLPAGTEYTMRQVRNRFPLPGERVEPSQEWSGEGLLTVVQRFEKYRMGDRVEVCMNGAWHTATVHGRAGDYIIARAYGYWYDEYTAENIRPIRSERERWVEDAHKIANDGGGFAASMPAIGAVYDALKSGELKAPE